MNFDSWNPIILPIPPLTHIALPCIVTLKLLHSTVRSSILSLNRLPHHNLRTSHLVLEYPDLPGKILDYEYQPRLGLQNDEQPQQAFTREWNIESSHINVSGQSCKWYFRFISFLVQKVLYTLSKMYKQIAGCKNVLLSFWISGNVNCACSLANLAQWHH